MRFHDTAYIELKLAHCVNRCFGVRFGVLEVMT